MHLRLGFYLLVYCFVLGMLVRLDGRGVRDRLERKRNRSLRKCRIMDKSIYVLLMVFVLFDLMTNNTKL